MNQKHNAEVNLDNIGAVIFDMDGVITETATVHASIMLKAGIHPKVVQERLGHASIQMTLDTYSHVAPGIQEAAAESFD